MPWGLAGQTVIPDETITKLDARSTPLLKDPGYFGILEKSYSWIFCNSLVHINEQKPKLVMA